MEHYVLRWRARSYSLIGPFATQEAVAAWGRQDQARDGDNPCWNTIQFADPHAAPQVFAPD